MGSGNTNNDILFDCQIDLIKGSITPSTKVTILRFILDYRFTKGKELNNNFSHDNWKGVACWLKRFEKDNLSSVPLLGRHSWRPDNLAFFLYAKNRLLGFPFIWIYLLFQIFDAIRMRKDAGGVPHTSGLLLNYFVLQTFNFNLTFKFVDWRVKKTFKEGWLGVFERYYTQPNNAPVLEAYKEIKGKYEL